MSKSQMIFDEIGTDVSAPVKEAILSIDRLERENARLKAEASKTKPEPAPVFKPSRIEETEQEDAED